MVGGRERGTKSWENRLLHEIDGYFWAIQPLLCFWNLWLFGHTWSDSNPTGQVHQLCDKSWAGDTPELLPFYTMKMIICPLLASQGCMRIKWDDGCENIKKKTKQKKSMHLSYWSLSKSSPSYKAILPSTSLFTGPIWRLAASAERRASSLSWDCQSHSSPGPRNRGIPQTQLIPEAKERSRRRHVYN